jgi:ribonuclease HI
MGEFHTSRPCPESERQVIERYTFDLPHLRTSNEAEWAALCRGLLALQEHGITGKVYVVGDSRLVLNQFTGQWRVWADNLRPLYQEARGRAEALDCELICEWRPRHVLVTWLGH